MNSRQRAKWLANIISEVQRYLSKAAEDAERPCVQRALEGLQDGRKTALEDGAQDK